MKSRIAKVMALLLFVATIPFLVGNSAYADMNHEYSDFDTTNPTLLNPNYDLTKIEVAVDDVDPNILYVWLVFNKPITASQFVYSTKHPWASVLIYRDLPEKLGNNTDDIRISTSTSQKYVSNNEMNAIASGNSNTGEAKSSLSSCNPKTWTDLNNNVNWIGFSIKIDCAEIPTSFWVTGYVDPDGSNSGLINDYDYAPEDPYYYTVYNYDVNNGSDTTMEEDSSLIEQEIYFPKVPDVSVSKKQIYALARVDSGLTVYVESITPKVCRVGDDYDLIYLLSKGVCQLIASQDGDDEYAAAPSVSMSFNVLAPITVKKTTAKKVSPAPKSAATSKSTPKPVAKK